MQTDTSHILQRARAAGLAAEAANDRVALIETGGVLERLGDFELAGRLLALAGRLGKPTHVPEWDGGPMRDGVLLVLQRIRHIGAPIRLARLIPKAARLAAHCIVVCDPRLAPLFRRSFPGVDVRAAAPGVEEQALAEADATASYETLMQHLWRADPSPDDRLKPDPVLVEQLRHRYAPNGEPLTGISWASTNERKDLPLLDDWAQTLRERPGVFVSLQYGDVADDVARLAAVSGCAVIHDPAVDSLADLDVFAAQVAAMDTVLTVSNTTAHMAGALGVRTVVLLDDKPHLVWPATGDTASPWYASLLLARRGGRAWPAVLAEANTRLGQGGG